METELTRAKKLEKIYNAIGFICIIGLTLSLVISVWFPIGGKLAATFLILLSGTLILFGVGPYPILKKYEDEEGNKITRR